jgi:hypothetical protein
MTANSKALQSVSPSEEPPSNGWESLLPLLDPVLVNLPHFEDEWKKLPRRRIFYLTHTVAKSGCSWLNHLSLITVVYHGSGAIHAISLPLHRFLSWAIPANYPDLTSLNASQALIAYFGAPLQRRGRIAASAYSSQQLHVQQYLDSLLPEQRKKLVPFILPLLIPTPKLTKLCSHIVGVHQAERKRKVHAVVHNFSALIAMGRRRYQWIADLDGQVQQVREALKQGQVSLPALIKCRDLDNRQDLTFRVWDRKSWLAHHRDQYHPKYLTRSSDSDDALFVQLVGLLPDTRWFLHAAEVGAMSHRDLSEEGRQYLNDCHVPRFSSTHNLLTSTQGPAQIIAKAWSAASGIPDDSRVLFVVEPLLAAAALGLFALACFTQTAMRMGELQQVAFDEECLEIRLLPQFDGQFQALAPKERMVWNLYPKGKKLREPYDVTPFMQEALVIWMQVHERFCGPWKRVSANVGFTHAHQFSKKCLFAVQWQGHHLAAPVIESCLDFLLLEHMCQDSNGQLVRITAHVLRHGLASHLRNQGVPLEDIMELLHQLNIVVTAYYSKPSSEDLYVKIGPFLTRLGELAEIDPSTVRTRDDLNNLAQAALKRFGILCHLPGGDCCSLQACENQYKCAACSSFAPDPTRRLEIENKVAVLKKLIQLAEEEGEYIQARNLRSHLHSWERVLKEVDGAVAVQIKTRPLSEMLGNLGINNTSDAVSSALATPPGLLPGDMEHG